MNLKKIKTISIFGTFILCFLTHFIYELFPNFITSIFFPVNESVWEHMKMIVSSIIIWEILLKFFMNKYKINFNNFYTSLFVMCFCSIIIFLLIYYPIYSITGENIYLNLICLFITIYFVNIIGYYILKMNNFKFDYLGIFGIIIIYVFFTLFTYYPPKNNLFFDRSKNIYGIKCPNC